LHLRTGRIGRGMTTTIGNTIKAARIARGLTLQSVAESLGLRSRQQIYEWESGRVCPGPKHLAKLAEVLGLDVRDLLPRRDITPPIRLSVVCPAVDRC
jgi:transcriptional regulator with XRE-family HTH domain